MKTTTRGGDLRLRLILTGDLSQLVNTTNLRLNSAELVLEHKCKYETPLLLRMKCHNILFQCKWRFVLKNRQEIFKKR